MSTIEKVHITVAGRGVIVGEELLVTGNEYEYSLRVILILSSLS